MPLSIFLNFKAKHQRHITLHKTKPKKYFSLEHYYLSLNHLFEVDKSFIFSQSRSYKGDKSPNHFR